MHGQVADCGHVDSAIAITSAPWELLLSGFGNKSRFLEPCEI